jgi:hypothetical protein
LATFRDEFREGMLFRAGILGDTGDNAPEHWVGGLAGDDLHAIAILFSRSAVARSRSATSCSQGPTASATFRTWISMRHRRSTMSMTTSASAIGCRNR